MGDLSESECARIRGVAVSSTLPGFAEAEEGAPEGIARILREVSAFFPLTPILLVCESSSSVGAPPAGGRLGEIDGSPSVVLDRPLDEERVRAAAASVGRFQSMLTGFLRRHCFRNQSLYLEEPIARIVHDLNNQITGLKGGVDLMGYSIDMIRDADAQEKFRRYLEQFILPSLGQIELQIKNWQQLRDTHRHTLSPIDLAAAARQAVELAASPPQRLRIDLRVGGEAVAIEPPSGAADETVECLANSDQLAFALASIMQNALEATEGLGGARILVEIDRAPDNMAAIRIFDGGEGIPEDVRPRVWRSFFSTKGRMGLGLSITKQVIDKLQGQIQCVPSPLGGAGIELLKSKRFSIAMEATYDSAEVDIDNLRAGPGRTEGIRAAEFAVSLLFMFK